MLTGEHRRRKEEFLRIKSRTKRGASEEKKSSEANVNEAKNFKASLTSPVTKGSRGEQERGKKAIFYLNSPRGGKRGPYGGETERHNSPVPKKRLSRRTVAILKAMTRRSRVARRLKKFIRGNSCRRKGQRENWERRGLLPRATRERYTIQEDPRQMAVSYPIGSSQKKAGKKLNGTRENLPRKKSSSLKKDTSGSGFGAWGKRHSSKAIPASSLCRAREKGGGVEKEVEKALGIKCDLPPSPHE